MTRRRDIWRPQRKVDGGTVELQDAAGSGWGMMPKAAKEYQVSSLLEGAGAEDTPDEQGLHGGESEFEEFDGVPSF